MQTVFDAFANLFHVLAQSPDLILPQIAAAEIWFRAMLDDFDIPPAAQTALLAAIGCLLILGCVRLFKGLLRIALVAGVVALLVQLGFTVISD